MLRIGVDSGGTFTDFVVLREDGSLQTFKLRSNPAAPQEVILEGLRRARADEDSEVVHGSTVATNALLERKGARTAFVTTDGFEDLLEIGRQNRARLYDLTPGPKRLLIPRGFCFGVAERTHANGRIEAKPGPVQLQKLAKRLREAEVESVAICFLHSYLNPENEQALAAALEHCGYLSVSSSICPEYREYERASTTALNAYVGPIMSRYLSDLGGRAPKRFWVMQSNGGALTTEEAQRFAVRTLLSGPAGGVIGAMETARAAGFSRILGFDMGGTSTDVSLCDGAPRESSESFIEGFPVRLPMLEIHTVGAGGGSIARIDEGGLLRVGPESAGADPGPACYGTGEEPTVTDAHVVLGRIGESQLAGGSLLVMADLARQAIQRLASSLGVGLEEAAEGVIRVSNATMTRAIRVVSVERGYDPRDFALLAFGGCGGLHACELADDLGIRTVFVPRMAGALSALGMLMADRVRDAARGVLGGADPESAFQALESDLQAQLPGASLDRSADLRYMGQSYELTVPWMSSIAACEAFTALHQRTYGYVHAGREVEVVTVRVRARQGLMRPVLTDAGGTSESRIDSRLVFTSGAWVETGVLNRGQVGGEPMPGPVLIADYDSTTLVPAGWRIHKDRLGNLIVLKG